MLMTGLAIAMRYECDTCDRCFWTPEARSQHMSALDHYAPRFECESCERVFGSEESVNQHMQAKRHWANYCRPCNRWFANETNYRAHLNSFVHRGTEVDCPYCDAEFVTASGVLHHLESDSCQCSCKSRVRLYREIQKRDTTGRIANGSKEGYHWVCDWCGKSFISAEAVGSHLLSSVHDAEVYHCLNDPEECDKNFRSLAAMFNHLESESCGFTCFEDVPSYLNAVIYYVDGGFEIPKWSLDRS